MSRGMLAKQNTASSMASADFSNHTEEPFPKFIFVTADKDFQRSSVLIGAKRHAEVLQGKMFRKTGSCKVLSLSDSNSEGWSHRFYPASKLYSIYRKHPFDDERYLGVKCFHTVLLEEKK